MLNYYHILGVPIGSSTEAIKQAYREQIKFFHPDVFQGNPEIAYRKTLILNEAYEILSNPDKRREYDARLIEELRKNYESKSKNQQSTNNASTASEEWNPVHHKTSQDKSSAESNSQTSTHTSTSSPSSKSTSSVQKWFSIIAAALFVFVLTAYFSYEQGYLSAKEEFDKSLEITSLTASNKRLQSQIDSLKEQLAESTEQLTKTENSLNDAEFRLSFWDDHAAIVTEHGTKYHKFYCYHLGNMDYFYIYNTELAESLGYTACKDCHSSTPSLTKIQ